MPSRSARRAISRSAGASSSSVWIGVPPAAGGGEQRVERRGPGLARGACGDRLTGAGVEQRRHGAVRAEQHAIERVEVGGRERGPSGARIVASRAQGQGTHPAPALPGHSDHPPVESAGTRDQHGEGWSLMDVPEGYAEPCACPSLEPGFRHESEITLDPGIAGWGGVGSLFPRRDRRQGGARDGWRCRPMNVYDDHFAKVNPGDPLYRDLQLRGYNRRFVGTPDSVFVVDDTDQVVNAVDAVVASGKRLAVRSGGHCTEGLVDDPAVQCVIDLGQMDSVYYDRHRRAFAVEAGATLGRVYQALDMSWGVTLPGGIGTGVGMGGT